MFNSSTKTDESDGIELGKEKMKKVLRLSFMAALVILMCLPSCTKPEKQIIGKWKITYAKVDGYKIEEAKGETWAFKDNGKFSGYLCFPGKKGDAGGDIDCNWFIDGNELVLKGGDLEVSESGSGWSYSVEGVITMDIEQLDKKELVVSGKMKVEYSEYEDGNTYHDTETYNVSYELEAK